MMVDKVVALVVSPLGTAWLLLMGAFVLGWPGVRAWARLPRWLGGLARAMAGAALAWLWLWSTPLASDTLCAWLERQAGPREVAALPAMPVAVVLGGGIHGPVAGVRTEPDLTAAADRLWHAARLYHAGKAPLLLLSGGTTQPGQPSEAQSMQRFLLALGVPAQALWLEEASINTATNAQRTADQLRARGVQQVLLVTSAQHMRRARANFERTGLVVHPAPTDFNVVPQPQDIRRVLPDAGALEASARAFKEVVGYWVGR